MEGWIKLHRKLIDWEWYTDSKMVHLLFHLVAKANHKDGNWKGIEVKRGQLITGLDSLKHQTGISTQSLRTCLERLKSTGEITNKSTNKYRIITILKYDSYQLKEKDNKQLTNNQQTTNKQLTANKNVNNDKNENNKQTVPFEKRHVEFSKWFYSQLQSNMIISRKSNPESKGWVNPIKLLEERDGIEWEQIKKGALFYFKHHEEKFMPVIQSTTAFREKWESLRTFLIKQQQE